MAETEPVCSSHVVAALRHPNPPINRAESCGMSAAEAATASHLSDIHHPRADVTEPEPFPVVEHNTTHHGRMHPWHTVQFADDRAE